MPGVPSNKACERCKKRHLKCDETRPSCQRCANAGVECPGYVQTRKFIDQGASVRRRYAPYKEGNPKSNAAKTSDSTAGDHPPANATLLRSDLAASTGWQSGAMNYSDMQSPIQDLRSDQVNAPFHVGPAAQMTNSTVAEVVPVDVSGPGQSSNGSSRSVDLSPITPNNAPTEPFSAMNNSYRENRQMQRSPNAGLIQSTSPSQHSEREEFQHIFSELMKGTEHEIAFLIRYFSETLSTWLDLSDSRKFFGAYVPVRSINESFLKFSIAALSAKHLGRMKGATVHVTSGMFTSPATMETYPNAAQVDWFLKAANYYFLAVSRMNSSISDTYTSASSSAILESPIEIVRKWLNLHVQQPTSQTLAEEATASTFWRKTENLLAASAILTMYKLLDEKGENWQSQLRGIRPLFETLLELHTSKSDRPEFSQGATAAFWNFARQDYLASYYTRCPPHFDHQNLPLWRAVGLPIDQQGNILSFESRSPNIATPRSPEDFAATSLIWLLNKVINFLAESKKSQLEQWTGQTPNVPSSTLTITPTTTTPPRSYPTTSAWLKLSFEFQSWLERIPETFRPCIRLEHPKDVSKLPEIHHMPFPEIFYGLTSCAAAMQQYHFGRLALSLNRPSDEVTGPSTAFDRLQGYRDLMKETDYRCKEICGIALSRPKSAARFYMVPLLYAVGQCFENPEERQIVTDLLRGIEADLGLATAEQLQKLQSAWCQT
ncbi:hypothetical protein EYZ11_004325 [Aspergillus tanneri]|uniref:Zn(2)-C6 fungal-type domain-containing protein n=1 Tax=Aspergillus tanneri TaxID=1220188 RepID=A0A4S3JKW5_9EURO|nr:uncharacterized protein ATNIH1004_002281 [Aspergillus tanneri]KAA8649610.1 hypothetical protein ATNIH1004_002281 [Aspergillus tanneri]THC96206.1 hypothetical protein EYZ11_004325 [Aspergillus tanneri]